MPKGKGNNEKQRFEVLLEEINKKVDLVLEGHQLLDKKIDDARQELIDRIDETNSMIRLFAKEIHQKLGNHERRIKELETVR